jgi:hypothetical protein
LGGLPGGTLVGVAVIPAPRPNFSWDLLATLGAKRGQLPETPFASLRSSFGEDDMAYEFFLGEYIYPF